MTLLSIHRKSSQLKLLKILLALVAIGFLLLFAIVAYHNRFLSDDYQYYDIIRKQGWLESFRYYYTHQTIRWSALFIFNSLFFLSHSFYDDHLIIFVFHLLSMALLVYALFLMLSNICRLILKELPALFYRLIFSVFFAASFYFATFQIAESWFWILSNLIHLQNIIVSILGIAFVIKLNKKIWDHVAVVICFIYVGGAAENYSVFLLVILSLLLFYLRFYRKDPKSENCKPIITGILIAIVSMLISFIVNISGPGIPARLAECHMQVPYANPDLAGEMGNFILNVVIQNKNLTFLLLSSLWIFAGTVAKIEALRLRKEKNKFSFSRTAGFLLASLVIVCIGITYPLYYAFNAIGPERAMSAISLMLTIIFCLFFLYMGLRLSIKHAYVVMIVISLSSIALLSYYVVKQYKITHAYAENYDSRCIYLESLPHVNVQDTIEVKGLPDSGMLPNGDITDDPDHFININFMKALGLNFKVKSSDNYYKTFPNKWKTIF